MAEIVCDDAFSWLPLTAPHECIFSSLPDAEEIGLPVDRWAIWFVSAARLLQEQLADGGAIILFQTDRKAGGKWHSKAAALHRELGTPVWHRIVLRREVGRRDLHRPGYSHLIAWGPRPGTNRPDVIEPSSSLYKNGTPVAAVEAGLIYARELGYATITDPFCGRGTIPSLASLAGFKVQGCDISPAQVALANG